MEKWEYLLVRVGQAVSGPEYKLSPSQRYMEDRMPQKVGPDETVALLDQLGDAGWELVSADAAANTYWLKRPQIEAAIKPDWEL